MSTEQPRWEVVQEVLGEALELAPEDRAALLDERCGRDSMLRAELESLIEASEDADLYFDDLADRAGMTLSTADLENIEQFRSGPDPAELTGRQIGQYDVIEWLGSGGMASVYLAERRGEGFTQRVALKLVSRRRSDPVIQERSNEERRILAKLEHRNIARLIDGGLTSEGFPYYAMEYVDGISVLEYSDLHCLRVKQRLELFLEVCAPVQFAHERLVVHCDLKPTNIFVTEEGHVKLLDFGVARLINPDSEADELNGLWFTPSYASPEQVCKQALGTHSDVYSLGVLLYELLSGHRPYRFASRDQQEVARVVCEVLPAPPSEVVTKPAVMTRAGEVSEVAASLIAERRSSNPERLKRRLQGDLDAIVMKALAKDPQDRYRTAEQLAADIRRHLDHETVSSMRPTASYRLSKIVRRHRGVVAAASIVAFTLIAGAGATAWQAARATSAATMAREEAERAELVADLMMDMFRLSDPSESLGDTITARQILDRGAQRILEEFGDQPVEQARLLTEISGVYTNLGLYSRAEPLVRRTLEIHQSEMGVESLEASATMARLGQLQGQQGELSEAIELLERAVEIREPLVGFPDSILIRTKGALAWRLRSTREYGRAGALFTQALEGERALDSAGPGVAEMTLGLAATFHDEGQFDQADSLFASVLDELDEASEPSPLAVSALTNVGMIRRLREEFASAEPLLRAAVDMAIALHGSDHVNVFEAQAQWGLTLYGLGRWSEAEEIFRDAVDRSSRLMGPLHQQTAGLQEGLATVLFALEDFDESIGLHELALSEKRRRHEGRDHPGIVASMIWLAESLIGDGRLGEAEIVLAEATTMNARLTSDPSVYSMLVAQGRGNIARRRGDLTAAEGYFVSAAALGEGLLRSDHRYLQGLKRDFGMLLGDMGRDEEAISMLEWVLQVQRDKLGERHPQTERTVEALRDLH